MREGEGNKVFDKLLREKLNSLQPPYQAGSWEQMADRLDMMEAADAFDASVEEQLRKVEVNYQQTSWQALAARLDQVETSDEVFDATVEAQLRRVKVGYRQSTWQLLATRLELERQRMRAIAHYKTMEVTLLLLLFITAWQHLPLAEPVPVRPAVPTHNIPIAAAQTNEGEQIQEYEGHTNLNYTIPTVAAVPELDQLSIREVESLTATVQLLARFGNNDIVDPLPGVTFIKLPTATPQDQLMALRAEKAAALSTPTDDFAAIGIMTSLESITPGLLNYGNPNELLDYIRPSERQTFVRVGFLGSPDYNRVVTPPQTIANGEVFELSRYALGYSGGLTIGVEHNDKWEVETGFIYSARRYQAIPTVFVSGSVREGFTGYSLQDFELNTFSAPLNFRYNLLVHDKWRLYTQMGGALNVVVQANYYAANENAFASLRGGSNDNPRTGTSAVSKPELLKRKNFNGGWLHGGSLRENATLYGELGFGVERYMTPNWSMFVQPHYQQALPFFNEGLGPYRDRISSMAIRLGVKARL